MLNASGVRSRRRMLLCGAVPVIASAALAIARPAFLARLDDSLYDVLLRSARTRGPGQRVVIVDVDERSLSTIGQWPWRRDIVGRLVTRLREAGASVTALDIVFPESDRYQGSDDAEAPSTDGRTPSPDAALAGALRAARVVLGYGLTFDAGRREPHRCVLNPIGVAVVRPPEDASHEPLFHATDAVCNLPTLSQAAAASGFLNAAPDADGILRRVPLLAEFDGRTYPGLALAAVMAATGAHDLALRVHNVNASTLTIDGLMVPVDGRGNLLLRYRGKKRTFPYVSAADVLSGQVPPSALRDKIAFVGTTALGTREVVATPLDTLFAGVEVQATVADNLLERDFIRRSALGTSLEASIVLVGGGAVVWLIAAYGINAGLIAAAAGLAGLWYGAAWLLSSAGVFVSPFSPIAAVLNALAVMTFAKFTVERRRADTASREQTKAQSLMIQALLSLTEVRDAETGRHSRRTQQYARLLAEQLATQPDFRVELSSERIHLLSTLAPLHDIGKVGIRDGVLNKPGELTPEELAEMRTHPALGRAVILNAEARVGVRDDATLEMAKDIVYTHHERWDGSGYPQGLSGRQIPVAGRVMALVDVYDAVRTRTLYKSSLSHEDAVSLILRGRNTHFDPAVVDAFVRVAEQFRHVSGTNR